MLFQDKDTLSVNGDGNGKVGQNLSVLFLCGVQKADKGNYQEYAEC